jgi:hypothetical protein
MESPRLWSQRQALTLLEEALATIEDCEKEDYLRALEVAPKLVLLESDPTRFLRFTNFNAAAAARKLVLYWKRRREVFGDRAFLPLSLTGNGALSTDDIESIKTGSLVFLPNDADGRTVMCFDPSRRLDYSIEIRLRSTFFFCQVVSENEKSQTDGFVMLIAASDIGRKINTSSTRLGNLVLNTFPMKVKAGHVIKWISKTTPIFCLARALARFAVRVYGHLPQGYQAYFHASEDKDAIVQSLEFHGLSRSGLPRFIGGSWSYERYSDWMNERAQMDREWHLEHSLPTAVTAPGGAASLVATVGDGSTSGVSIKRDEMYQYLRNQIVKAIELLPQDEKASYIEALEKAPAQVWKEESNPDMFLRVEDFHPYLAAKRLCSYWRLRSEIFGPKRFDSLYQTGEDALGIRELRVLQTQSMMLLPKDAEGCPVLSIDGTCLEKRRNWIENRDRCIFYMNSLLAEDEMSQQEGAVLLYKMDSPPFHSVDVAFLERLATSLPLRFKAVHLLSHEPISHDVESQVKFGDKTYVHVGSSNDELASQLEEFGMNKAGLPRFFNGEWGLGKYIEWQELRTRMEFKISLCIGPRDHLKIYDEFPSIKPYSLLPENEKSERSRRLNVVHCRRQRDQRRVESEALEEGYIILKGQHTELLEENRRLEDLVRTAVAIVEQVEEEQGDPTSAQAETSSSFWGSPAVSETRDSISTSLQGLLGFYSPSSTGGIADALNSATRAETSSPTWSSADFSETQ